MLKLEKILLEITQLDPSKECLKFLANRIKSSDYRGLHLSQHNRYDQNKIKTIIQAIFNEVGGDFLQIRTTDMSKRPSNIIGEEVYAKVVDSICKSEMPQDNSGKKNQVTQDSLRKNLFVDMHRMGLIERYNKNKESTNPYIQSNIKYISLTPLAIEFLNAQDLLRKNFCYTQALENLLQGFGAECREVMIELDNHYLDIEEMMFFVTFLNIANFTRSEIIEYVREYRSLSRIQKEKLKELAQDYCNPNHFNGNKLEKRDYHNWKNQAQQIFSLLEQSVFFETNKEMLILKTLNEENKQNDKKLKRSIKEKALYFEKHGVKKEKGFELHHIVPLCLARSIEEFDLLDKWENLIYIDAFNHAKISQTQNKHICLYFENCDVVLSKGLKEEQESLYFIYIENVLYKLDLQNAIEYRSLSRIQKEKLKELAQDYCNPNHFNGNKLEKRDYHNWKNQAQQIFSLLEQSVFFETNKEMLILKTLNEENKQNDKKLKRSIKEKALYFEKHGVKKEKGFELHHIVPLCLARSIEEFDLLDKWENLIYIDAFNHAKISQTQNKHICLYFENCDVVLSKGLKEEQESLYFIYIENVLYKLDLQNAMLEYNKDLLHSKNG